MQDPGKEGI